MIKSIRGDYLKKMNLFNSVPIFKTQDMVELQLLSTSKGNQRKWLFNDNYVKEQFYYQDKYWRDDLVERIASVIGKQLETSNFVLEQSLCLIEDNSSTLCGIYSKDFLSPGEEYVSIQRMLEANNLSFDTRMGCVERYGFIRSFLESKTGLEFGVYLDTMILLDYLIGNEDRHLNNFGVIHKNGKFKYSPLFDFGLGLFEHDMKYTCIPFKQCLTKMECKPFSIDNQKIMDYRLTDGLRLKLPDKIDLSECEIPSAKAGSYLRNRCMHLGIILEGVE